MDDPDLAALISIQALRRAREGGNLSQALGLAKENVYAREHLKGYIVWGRREL